MTYEDADATVTYNTDDATVDDSSQDEELRAIHAGQKRKLDVEVWI